MQPDNNQKIDAPVKTPTNDKPEEKRVRTDPYGGFDPILVELSDALPVEAFLYGRLGERKQ